MKLDKITQTGKKTTVTASDEIFGVKVNQQLISQATRVYLSNQRQGTAKVKTRAEVNLTKAKVYRQKGTGNARHGAKSAHIFVGGGVAHGPDGTANWNLQLSQKQKRQALKSSLSAQVDHIAVSDVPLDLGHKTKEAYKFIQFATNKQPKNVLLILAVEQKHVERAFHNLPNVQLQDPQVLTSYDILRSHKVIFTTQALQELEARLLDQPVKVKATKTTPATVKETAKSMTTVRESKAIKQVSVKKAPVAKKTSVAKKTAKKVKPSKKS